jgi:hypothetical protein
MCCSGGGNGSRCAPRMSRAWHGMGAETIGGATGKDLLFVPH